MVDWHDGMATGVGQRVLKHQQAFGNGTAKQAPLPAARLETCGHNWQVRNSSSDD
jgi:hypothetical protein